MSERADTSAFESDQFLVLLTDALRAGPGSPEWHEAVTRLRAEGIADQDELRLLCQAREHLESGRDYRSIRPGPGFTRRVMAQIDEESTAGRAALPPASLIALLAGGAIVLVVLIVALMTLIDGEPRQPTAQDLAGRTFLTTALASDFAAGVPPEWDTFGVAPAPSTRERGLRGSAPRDANGERRGGGIVTAEPLPPSPLAIETTLRMTRPTSQVILQLFITSQPVFDNNPEATTPGEVTVQLHEGQLGAFSPDGKLLGRADAVADQPIHLMLKIDERFIVVESGGEVFYAGEHGLPAEGARWAGARFLTQGDRGLDDVTLQSIRILRP